MGDRLILIRQAPAPASLQRLTTGACGAILAGMEWALATCIVIGAIVVAWLLATRRGSPVEMPGGETIFRRAAAPKSALASGRGQAAAPGTPAWEAE
jgi:hypothetical protein